MCGIAGFLHFDQDRTADRALVKKMADTLIHRGPDGEGFYCHKNLALGHRRLSIIDLTTGDQPKFDEDRKLAIIFNGEIYNYIELREELKGYGHKFQTDSDTEVILKAYKQWGVEFQNKLNGMWAIALWDESRQQLLLSRDRIGEKPLYYSVYDQTLIFGSEIKSVISYGVPPKEDLSLSELYFTFGYVPAPFTFYKYIKKLEPGHYLMITNGSITEFTYWDLPVFKSSDIIKDKAKVDARFAEVFDHSVKIRMRSDVPFGALLSGGLDSASIVALMSGKSKFPIKTFTIGFSEKAFDESNLARAVANRFNTAHLEQRLSKRDLDNSLGPVMRAFDEPFGDSSALPTYYVSQLAAQHVKMVLTGDGGDEVLAGYNANQLEKLVAWINWLPKGFRNTLPPLIRLASHFAGSDRSYRIKRLAKGVWLTNQDFSYRQRAKLCMPENVEKLVSGLGEQVRTADLISDFLKKYPAVNGFYQLSYFQFKLLLPDDFLTKVDRMSMLHSLETRLPFLDYRLIEMMLPVSAEIKMRGFERKSILRRVFANRLPGELFQAPKRGFSVPLREWFKREDYKRVLSELLTNPVGLDKRTIEEIIESNNSGQVDYGNMIWMLLVFRDWRNRQEALFP